MGPPSAADDIRQIGADPEAFTLFYRHHVEEVLRFVTRRVSDPHLAADLTAEVFLAVIDASAGYRGAAGPRAWLYGIARNVIAAHIRQATRRRQTEARLVGRALLDTDDLACLEERIDAAAQARHLFAEMESLPEGERAVLELVALDGLTVTEAATALRIRPVTARVRLHRARRALAALGEDPAQSTQIELAHQETT